MENEKKSNQKTAIELTDEELQNSTGGTCVEVKDVRFRQMKQCDAPEPHLYSTLASSCPVCGSHNYTIVLVER